MEMAMTNAMFAPKRRQEAKAPRRMDIRADAHARSRRGRSTLVNMDGQVRRAPTARLGGQPVVLGG